jgi:two-component system sensor histidine kinase ChvG
VAIDNARLHEQRVRLIDQLQEADRRKDEFIATLSHELRNPLAPLRNGLHVLRLAPGPADPGMLGMMGRQVDQLVRLVDDLLEISRINRGTLALRRQPIDLQDVVRHAMETSEPLMREAGHVLEVDLPERELLVEGDAARLAQVLSNLMDNAVSFSPPAGTVTASISTNVDWVTIAIRDEGPGIRGDESRIFQRFYTDRPEGEHFGDHSGLGLAISKQIVEAHHGSIEAHNRTDRSGAVFTVMLPRAAGERSAARARK